MNQDFTFSVTATDSRSSARTGVIRTPHGEIKTPAFVPVGTQATVKSLTPEDLEHLGTELFFVNTYHAYLRPGLDVIADAGGLHRFMNWKRSLITDSGGFQIFSLGGKKFVNIALSETAVLDPLRFTENKDRKKASLNGVHPDDYRPVGELVSIDEDGVTFTSHWDGSRHRFTPEISMDAQHILGTDIMIAFDECAPYPTTKDYARKAMDRTHRWARRSLEYHVSNRSGTSYQALYGVVQGSVFEDLRKTSAETVSSLPFDGFAIGGVSVGESKTEMADVVSWTVPVLPAGKPRHLLGVGEIDDIFVLVDHGLDTFDCVQPTRLARMGILYTSDPHVPGQANKYTFDIRNSMYARDFRPPGIGCGCYTCRNYSRAYVNHLFRVRELLAYRLSTIHNIHFVNELMANIRAAIDSGSFLDLKKQWLYNTF